MSTAETAQIRQELKNAGYGRNKVSVRHQWCGYSDAIHVTIKDKSIPLEDVKRIAKRQEYYERDERTGEILAGGNTYVFVQYDYRLEV